MRYLAVPEMPNHSFWESLRHRGHLQPEWHAVADTSPTPIRTLCGLAYTAEAHRTWDQTLPAVRCPRCDHMVLAASRKGATFISQGVRSPEGT